MCTNYTALDRMFQEGCSRDEECTLAAEAELECSNLQKRCSHADASAILHPSQEEYSFLRETCHSIFSKRPWLLDCLEQPQRERKRIPWAFQATEKESEHLLHQTRNAFQNVLQTSTSQAC